MEIRKIKNNEKDIINEIVLIHLDTFEGFFLTFMGKGFLTEMYKSYCEHRESGVLVAIKSDKPIGFLAYSQNLSDLYKYMIKKHILKFAFYSLGAFFRKPMIFMRLIKAFSKPTESNRTERYVELASIGVSPNEKSIGVGSKLIDSLKKRVDFSKYKYITLETDAVNNDIAISFYIKNKFKKEREFETSEGRKMIEFRYAQEEKNENNMVG